MKYLSLSRLQLEKVLTEKKAQVELQASEITASEKRMRHLQTQLQQTEVELLLKCLTSCTPCVFVFQSEKVELEGECRAKNEQLAVRDEQIPVLRNELQKLRVRI